MAKVHPGSSPVKAQLAKGPTFNPVDFVRANVAVIRGDGLLGTLALRCDRPQELRERLKAMWTTMGLVSALLCGVGLPTVISPQQNWGSADGVTVAAEVVVYSIVISFGLSFTVVVLFTMLLFSIDMMPTDDAIKLFVVRFQHLNEVGVGLFMGSIVAIIIGCVASVYNNYGRRAFIVIASLLGALLVFLGINYVLIATYNALVILDFRQSQQNVLPGSPGDAAAAPVGSGATAEALELWTRRNDDGGVGKCEAGAEGEGGKGVAGDADMDSPVGFQGALGIRTSVRLR